MIVFTFTYRPQVTPNSPTPRHLGDFGRTCGLYVNMNIWVEPCGREVAIYRPILPFPWHQGFGTMIHMVQAITAMGVAGVCCAGAALAAGAGAVRSPDGPASLADGVAVRARPG